MVREELEKYDGGFADEWNDQRKKNAEVLGYKLSGKSDVKEGATEFWQDMFRPGNIPNQYINQLIKKKGELPSKKHIKQIYKDNGNPSSSQLSKAFKQLAKEKYIKKQGSLWKWESGFAWRTGTELESVNEGFTKYHIRLTNTRGWYGVWDKNGKQKFEGDRRYVTRQLKKLKTRMGNVQLKSLIDVATKRKGKNIEFDVVESVDEGLGDNVLKNLKKYKKRAGKNKAAMDAARKRKKKESVGEGTCGYTHTVDGKKLKTPGGTDDDISEAKKMNVKLLQVNAKHFARDVMDFYKELRSPDTEPESIIQQLDYLKDKVKMMRKNAGLKESVNEDTKLDLLKLYNKALKLPAKSPVQMKVRKKIATLRKKIGMDEAKESGIDIARRVVKNKQHEKGLDLTTANFIIQTYKAYNKNPRLQKKLDKMPLLKMVKLAHLVMK